MNYLEFSNWSTGRRCVNGKTDDLELFHELRRIRMARVEYVDGGATFGGKWKPLRYTVSFPAGQEQMVRSVLALDGET